MYATLERGINCMLDRIVSEPGGISKEINARALGRNNCRTFSCVWLSRRLRCIKHPLEHEFDEEDSDSVILHGQSCRCCSEPSRLEPFCSALSAFA